MTSNPAPRTADELDRPRTFLPAWLRAMRPKQWTKNILVFSAPLAAGAILDPGVAWRSAVAFVVFALISSAIYLINDIHDVAEDRLHPSKRFRPIAAGELSIPTAWVLAVLTAVVAIAVGWLISPLLALTLVAYLVLQIVYSMLLKHQPIIDLAIVSSGFLLRAIAGGVATGLELSQWFLLVASFGSLFMVAGKRYSEYVALGAEAGTRKSLARYSDSYLRFAWTLAGVCVVMSYSLWAFEHRGDGPAGIQWTAISIAPFTLAMLQYAMRIDTGAAGEPEDIVMRDRVLQVLGGIWLILIVVAVML
ncbi:decaprenyl-phosphate phosphoribosyltransferase [Enemella sp. A6]|uniref:decaprenyl-phosphate phosphoribosyltransferase n=1 Tax=Enemella sp. A6 TaxID=3440152 RepID=UPI003EBA6AD5